MFAYLMPFTDLFNAVCLHTAYLFPFYFALDISIVIHANSFINALFLGY